MRESISINERLQSAYAPYVAYVILPLFALANAGVVLSSEVLAGAAGPTLTWGIVVGLVAGKLLGVFGSSVPTLFINGRRHVGPYDARSLLRALTTATDTPVAEERMP
ncbi:Na+/H+ antiporter NhaA [Microbispora sp. NPDC049125]|uniref:Na+/H+ antiporter NhaA n=1 Tax=Microbispora sp. NPDC049125 TaxID=3154929 RepID=UPI0034677F86